MNDIDDQYRRASAQDPSQPSETTRRNILAHAAELAAQRKASKEPLSADFRRPAANQPSWRNALIGTLAAAGLAGLLVTPLFLSPRPPPSSESSPSVARSALPRPAERSERLYSMTPRAPVASAEPVAKLAPPTPATKRNFVEQGTTEMSGSVTADSARQDAVAPQLFAAAPAPAPAAAPEAAPPQAGAPVRAAPMAAASRMAGAARTVNSAAALQQAAGAGDLPSLQVLLAAPIDINARDGHGRTALMLATQQGQAGAVDTLIAHGADVNIADADGITPLQAALAGAQPGIAAALQRAGAR